MEKLQSCNNDVDVDVLHAPALVSSAAGSTAGAFACKVAYTSADVALSGHGAAATAATTSETAAASSTAAADVGALTSHWRP